MLPDDTFRGRVTLVTGGGTGLGLGIATEVARLGGTVVLLGRRPEVLEEAADSIIRAGGSAEIAACDIRDAERVDSVVADIVTTHGHLDGLVNSAAGNFRVKPEAMSTNAWRAVIDIVLNGTWHVTRAAGRHAIDSGHAMSVVSIGSIGATVGGPTTAHSASAKAGVLMMTRSLAAAWGPHGIRLNVVTPGIIAGTPGMTALFGTEEEAESYLQTIPARRFGNLDDVAHAASYLLSPYSSYVSGTNLFVDGGRALPQD